MKKKKKNFNCGKETKKRPFLNCILQSIDLTANANAICRLSMIKTIRHLPVLSAAREDHRSSVEDTPAQAPVD